MRQRHSLILVIAAALLPCACLADIAGPFTTTTPIPSTPADWTGSLAFPKFDLSLGTLTMVQLDLSGGFSMVLTVTNVSSSGSSGTAKTEVQWSVQDAGGHLIIPEVDLSSPNFAYTLGAGQSLTSGTLTKSGSSSDQYTDGAVLAEFTGPGTIVLPASTFTQTWLTNMGGDTSASEDTYAQLTGTVTYSYQLIPETSSIVMGLFLCAGGLGGLIPRRRGSWSLHDDQAVVKRG